MMKNRIIVLSFLVISSLVSYVYGFDNERDENYGGVLVCIKDDVDSKPEHDIITTPALDELVERGDLEGLDDYLLNPDPLIRIKAYDTLRNWELQEVESLLVRGLGDYDTDVRWKVAGILEEMGWEPTNSVYEVRYYIAKKEWDKAVSYGKVGEAHVLRILQYGDVEVRKGLVVALGKSGNMRYYDTLKYIYRHDENQEVRYLAYEALNELGESHLEEDQGWLSYRLIMIILIAFSGVFITVLFIIGLRRSKRITGK